MGSWQDLPSDVVRSIAERLPVDDFFRLGAVCRPWSGAPTGFRPVLMSPHFPWLVPTAKLTSKEVLPMYSPDNRRVHRLGVPGGSSRVVGCHRGWLVTVDDDSFDVHVFNPVTGGRASLPTLSNHRIDFKTIVVKRKRTRMVCSVVRVKKVALSSTPRPSAAGNGVVLAAAAVIINWHIDAITFAKVGDGTWSGGTRLPFEVNDVICCRGNFFAVGFEGQYVVVDPSLAVASSPTITLMLPKPYSTPRRTGNYYYNLVVSPSSGHLLVVAVRRADAARSRSKTRRLVVLKYNPGEDSPSSSSRWVETEDLGDEALFLGGGHAMLLPAGNGSGSSTIRRNCIYGSIYGRGSDSDALVTMFDVKMGVFEPSLSLLEQQSWMEEESPCWFLPSLS